MKKSVRRQRQAALAKQKQQRWIAGIILGVAAILLVLAAILAFPGESAVAAINPDDSQQVALGQEVYLVQCASCHGENLEGEENWQQPGEGGLIKAPPHDETGHTWHHSNEYLIDSLKKGGARLDASLGTSAMPAYEGVLSDEEMAAVIAYIISTWPADIRQAQAVR